jgi:hypothetical protein
MMDRREALQRTALLLGYAVSGSTLTGVLAGCRAEPTLDWSPQFLTLAQATTISEMSEHLLPKSDTPGAKDALVDRFIDAMLKNYFSPADQQQFVKGLTEFDAECRNTHGRSFAGLTVEQKDAVFRQQEAVTPPGFYRQFKELAITGYYTSEPVGKQILRYDPVPGAYDGCVPLEGNQNVWSLT